jgi:predicted homoserine dehydrogenase-like protein
MDRIDLGDRGYWTGGTMFIVDKALQEREWNENPVRVGMVGAGFMGRGIALQMVTAFPGMELVAIANRHPEGAKRAFSEAGLTAVDKVSTVSDLDDTIASDRHAVTENPFLLCESKKIDAIVEVTGTVEYAAKVALAAIEGRKHIILMNAELDGTLGPILKVRADDAGVVITNADGDQPGVILNLYRFVKGIGLKPILCGNIKGFHDPYRNPTTQEGFARKWGQKPHMVTSFADGSKISFEQTIVANATGMRVVRRGMIGPTVQTGTPIQDVMSEYPLEEADAGTGIVDYVVGAAPSPGVFVIGSHHDPVQQHYLNLYKMGEGPYYCFYTPYHLCHFEAPNTVARAVLFHDAAITPLGAPVVDVVAAAKKELQAGEILDGIGFYMTYGLCENSDLVQEEQLLPMGLVEGCRLTQNVRKDQVLTYNDVELPTGRICDRLRKEQEKYFR